MQLTYQNNVFVLQCAFTEKDVPKSAGFRWNPTAKQWQTSNLAIAKLFESSADTAALAQFEQLDHAAQKSTVSQTDFMVPCPDGKSFFPYQRAGIEYAAQRKRSLIGDEPGLGKTAQAIGQINLLQHVNVLIICPASLKQNWRNELESWLTVKRTIGIAEGTKFPEAQIVIINYDIIGKNRAAIDSRAWDFCIVDEAHYLKTPSAQRTIDILGGTKHKKDPVTQQKIDVKVKPIQAKRWCFLTGTPILNRPVELWPLAHFIAPHEFSNFFEYGKRYCNGYQKVINRQGDTAWDWSGASNLTELQQRVRSLFMVRRKKVDVLTELPPKIRQIIPVDKIKTDEKKTVKQLQLDLTTAKKAVMEASETEYETAAKKLRSKIELSIEIMAELRKAAAMQKLPYVFEIVDNLLAAGEKVVIFAYHHETIDKLATYYQNCSVVIDGRTKNEDRQPQVKRFQEDPAVTVFIGSIGAAGVGFTLTAASTVVFVELDWVPGNVSQAEDRLHRIGQTAQCVNVLHIVVDGSIDAYMAKSVIAKQAIIEKALDDGLEGGDFNVIEALMEF